jgi:hypothetical protein
MSTTAPSLKVLFLVIDMALRDLSEMSLRRNVQEHMNRILHFYRLSNPLQVSGCSYAVALPMFLLLTSYSDICTQCSISQLFYFCFMSDSSKQLTLHSDV